jgi:hypothetical protein
LPSRCGAPRLSRPPLCLCWVLTFSPRFAVFSCFASYEMRNAIQFRLRSSRHNASNLLKHRSVVPYFAAVFLRAKPTTNGSWLQDCNRLCHTSHCKAQMSSRRAFCPRHLVCIIGLDGNSRKAPGRGGIQLDSRKDCILPGELPKMERSFDVDSGRVQEMLWEV